MAANNGTTRMTNDWSAEYPFESHYLDLSGHRLHYLDEGPRDAPPIVMVHGNPSWSFYFRRLVLALRGRHRVIVPDHIGMGLSDKPDDKHYEYSLRQRVDDLEQLIQHIAPDGPITLVVHDWGGMIGMAFAMRVVLRIERLILLNTAAFHLPPEKPLPWQLALCRSPVIGPLLIRGFNAFCRGAARGGVIQSPLSPAARSGLLHPYNSWNNRRAVLRFVQDIPLRKGHRGYDLVSETEAGLKQFVNCPTLICWGMKDFVFDQHFLAAWQKFLPHAEVHRFEEAGHYILEDAHAQVVPLVERFVDSRSAASIAIGSD